MWCSGWKTHGHWPFCPASKPTRPEITPISTKSRGPASCLRHTPSPGAPPPVWGKKVRRRPFHTPFVPPVGKSTSQRGLPMSIVIHGSSKQCRRKQCYPKPQGFHSRFPSDDKILKKKKFLSSPASKIQKGEKNNWAVPPGFHAWWLSKKKENQTRELVCEEEEGRFDRVDNHLRCNSQKRSNHGHADRYFWMQILRLN